MAVADLGLDALGALFDLNPLLERDGYHVLVDLLREPGLRRRSSGVLTTWIAGHGGPDGGSRHLLGYAFVSVLWSLLTVAFGAVVSLRYYHRLAQLAPPALVWTVLAGFCLVARPAAGRAAARAVVEPRLAPRPGGHRRGHLSAAASASGSVTGA